jgi:hypothetical protein
MDYRKLLAAGAAATILFSAGAANAAKVLVGSWRLTDGPAPSAALSAQEAAAQLFGGNAADYFISTEVAKINEEAWYVIVGMPGNVLVDSQGSKDFFGLDISAYAFDAVLAAEEDRFVNYAFREQAVGPGIPEPATRALMIGGFGLAGAALRRRRAATA